MSRTQATIVTDQRTIPCFGQFLRQIVGSAETESRLTLAELVCPPGVGVPIHRHTREDEGIYILDGEFLIQDGEQKRILKKGDYVHFPKGLVHGYANVSDKPCRHLTLTTPGGYEKFFDDLAKIAPDNIPAVAQLCATYGVEIVGPPPSLAQESLLQAV